MPVLRTLIRTAASVIAFLLLFAFILRIFAPGNADTRSLFQLISFIQPFLDASVAFFVFPVQWVLNWLTPYFPAGMSAWFPITQAAAFFEGLVVFVFSIPSLAATALGQQMLEAPYPTIFPGVLDWRLLMAIGFWGLIESLLLKVIISIEARTYRSHIRKRDADILAGLRNR
ncbi:hypothetical protein [Vampirovibrio sp.]|uniref:hypothetical protein n=1 Tax=Vampirovibrio sp. TaxID=2717857 RepID=UPI00359474FA